MTRALCSVARVPITVISKTTELFNVAAAFVSLHCCILGVGTYIVPLHWILYNLILFFAFYYF